MIPPLSKRSCLKNGILLTFVFWVNLTTTGGFIYGMSSLTTLMDKELGGKGQLYQKCKTKDDCTDRDQIYANIFSVAVGFASGGNAGLGFIMDYLGPKATCLIGLLIFTVGNWLIATTDSSKDDPDLAVVKFMIGFSCMALGGIGPFISAFNIANITDGQTTVTSLIAALFNLAGLAYFAAIGVVDQFDVAVDDQRRFIGFMFFYLGIGNFVVAYLIWPVRTYAPHTHVENLIDFRLWKDRSKAADDESTLNLLINRRDRSYIPLNQESARNQILSKEFLLITSFYSFYLLSMSFYFGTVYTQMDPSNNRSWLHTVILVVANAVPILLAWPCARLMDKFGFAFGMGTICVCSVLMFGILMTESMFLYVVSTGLFAIFRTFLFSTFFGFIGATFGFTNYGVILGTSTICAAVVSQLGLVLNHIGFNSGFVYVDVGLVVGAALFFPLSLTQGVWEGDKCEGEEDASGNFGSRLTYKWSSFAMVTPRRLKYSRQRERETGSPSIRRLNTSSPSLFGKLPHQS